MGYAVEADIRRHLGKYSAGWTASSVPSVADGLEFADHASAEIDAILGVRGLATPITTPAVFVERLRDLAALYAASLVSASLFPQAAGPASTTHHEFLMTQYRAGLDALRRGEILTATTSSPSPRSLWTTTPTDPDTDEPWEPVFTRLRAQW